MNERITILISGSNGQLGSELKERAASHPDAHFVFLSRDAFSITDGDALKACFDKYRPAYFINCAAYTAVDKAEEERELAFAVNADAPGKVAELCAAYQCRLIHISTDYVFDGTSSTPLDETQPVQPLNTYGASKLKGEELVMQVNPDSLIIRTSWVYSQYGKNFVKTMMRLMQERSEISVVADQKGSPTYAADLAEAILAVIFSGSWVPGIYHFSNHGTITWYEFAEAIRKETGSNCKVLPITTDQYPTPAKRPAWSVMDTSKFTTTFGIAMRPWLTSLEACLAKLKASVASN